MAREIIAVYQDCVLCGVKGRRKIAAYAEKGFIIRKVGFTTEEGRELCYQAIQRGIGYMPFYVSDDEFAASIDALIPKKPKTAKKLQKKANLAKNTKITEKDMEDGVDSAN